LAQGSHDGSVIRFGSNWVPAAGMSGGLDLLPKPARSLWLSCLASRSLCGLRCGSRALRTDVPLRTRALRSLRLPGRRWAGIAACGECLYCAPSGGTPCEVLEVDCAGATAALPVPDGLGGHDGSGWCGAAELGGRVFCCPKNADCVLVVEPATRQVSAIPVPPGSGFPFDKWEGIASCGPKLYCAPCKASAVLVIDPAENSAALLPVEAPEDGGDDDGYAPQGPPQKWLSIAACGERLVCPPCGDVQKVLVVNAAAGACSTLPCPDGAWRGASACGGKVYCCPVSACGILAVDPLVGTTALVDWARSVPPTVELGCPWGGASPRSARVSTACPTTATLCLCSAPKRTKSRRSTATFTARPGGWAQHPSAGASFARRTRLAWCCRSRASSEPLRPRPQCAA